MGKKLVLVGVLCVILIFVAHVFVADYRVTQGNPSLCETKLVKSQLRISYAGKYMVACVTTGKQAVSDGWNGVSIEGYILTTVHPTGESVQVKLITRIVQETGPFGPFSQNFYDSGVDLRPGDVVRIDVSDKPLPVIDSIPKEIFNNEQGMNFENLAGSEKSPAASYAFAFDPIRIAATKDEVTKFYPLPLAPQQVLPPTSFMGAMVSDYDPTIGPGGGVWINPDRHEKIISAKIYLDERGIQGSQVRAPVWYWDSQLVISQKLRAGDYQLEVTALTGRELPPSYKTFLYFKVK